MKKLENIVFDFDGVLVDNYDLVFKIFKKYDKKLTPENFLDIFNGNSMETLENRNIDIKNFLIYFSEEYLDYSKNERINKEIIKILNKLSKKYRLFIISSNSETVINFLLKNNRINVFKKVLGIETNFSKTFKFKLLEEEYKISPQNTIFITDTLGDVKEAHKRNYKVLAETFGYHNKTRLKKGKPEWIANSWEEILRIIK